VGGKSKMPLDNNHKRLDNFTNIGAIGSIEYQRHWCVNGTAKEYILLDELIETSIYAAKHCAAHPILSKSLSTEEREALIRFHDRVQELYTEIPWRDPKVSITEIVEHNSTMQQIRDAANECLRALGISYTTEQLMSERRSGDYAARRVAP
jgi:hypothetical protein